MTSDLDLGRSGERGRNGMKRERRREKEKGKGGC
jgi:hypothetical protein